MKRTVAPTLVVLALGVALHVLLAVSPFFALARGGRFMILVAIAGLLCVLLQNWLAHRPSAASAWLALPPAVVVLLGTLGVAGQIRQARLDMIGEAFALHERAEVFAIAAHDATAVSVQACTLAALSLAHAAWLLSARDRLEPRPRSAQWVIAVIGGLLATGALFAWRTRAGIPVASAGALTPAMVLLAVPGLALAGQRFSVSGGLHTDRKAWGALLASSVLAVGSVAFTSIGGWLSAMQCAFDTTMLGAFDAASKSRLLAEHARHGWNELSLGLFAGLSIAAVALVIALSRTGWASVRALRTPAAAACVVALTAAAPMLQAVELMREFPQYREGRPGELIEDASLPPGTLLVELRPLLPSIDTGLGAEVRLSTGATAKWKSAEPARVDGLLTGQPLTLAIGFPYLSRELPPVVLPPDRGARLVVGVMRAAPLFRNDTEERDRVEPEKLLHVDLTNPDKYVLYWASGPTVMATRDAPRSLPALAGAASEDWRQYGSHKNDNDRRQDIAILHYAEPLDFDDLHRHAAAITLMQRTFKGERQPVFLIYVAPTPASPVADLDDELAAIPFDTMTPEEAASRAEDALRRCKGTPCGFGNDLWGIRKRERCGQTLCSTGAQALLWMQLGKALALQGNAPQATIAFGRARLLSPGITLESASPAVRAAFQSTDSLPAAHLRLGSTTINGRLSPQVVRSVIESRAGMLRACYSDAQRNNPNLQGRVALRFVIGRDGAAGPASNGGSDIPDPSVVPCCMRALAGLQFPAPEGGIVTVVQPFMFSP